jgi:putative colanic acid biosynthesis acetyltransferase WcaF
MDLEHYTVGTFNRGAPRWKEALWMLSKCLFFLPAIPFPSGMRVWLLRLFGAKIGRGVVIRSRVHITYPWRLVVGDFVWFGEEVLILSLAPVTIGSHVCISQRAFLCTGSHRFQSQAFDLDTKPITIGERSWVAAQVFIAPGVTLGTGSMAGAGSVVLQDVPAGTVVRGNPATPLRAHP